MKKCLISLVALGSLSMVIQTQAQHVIIVNTIDEAVTCSASEAGGRIRTARLPFATIPTKASKAMSVATRTNEPVKNLNVDITCTTEGWKKRGSIENVPLEDNSVVLVKETDNTLDFEIYPPR